MQAKLNGTIVQMKRTVGAGGDKVVELEVEFTGSIESYSPSAKQVAFNGKLYLKPVVAEQLKIGTHFKMTLTEDIPQDLD